MVRPAGCSPIQKPHASKDDPLLESVAEILFVADEITAEAGERMPDSSSLERGQAGRRGHETRPSDDWGQAKSSDVEVPDGEHSPGAPPTMVGIALDDKQGTNVLEGHISSEAASNSFHKSPAARTGRSTNLGEGMSEDEEDDESFREWIEKAEEVESDAGGGGGAGPVIGDPVDPAAASGETREELQKGGAPSTRMQMNELLLLKEIMLRDLDENLKLGLLNQASGPV